MEGLEKGCYNCQFSSYSFISNWFYYAGVEITLNSDVTNYNRLIFLFGSPNSPGDGYETEEVYPWGIVYGSNELGATQPNIGMIVGVKKLCLNGYPTQK